MRATHGRMLVRMLVLTGLLGLAVWWWRAAPSPASAQSVATTARANGAAAPPAPEIDPPELPGFLTEELRTALDTTAAPTDSSAPAASDDFDALLEELVTIVVRANDAMASENREDPGRTDPRATDSTGTDPAATDIQTLDSTGREILQRILKGIEDPDGRALFKLTGLPSEDTTVHGIARRQLCLGILRHGLDRKLRRFEHGGSRNPLDHLVHGMLTSIPQDEVVARDLAAVLTKTPYLGVAHETPVLDLITLAAEEQYLIPLTSDLLQTLWDNLQASGARTSEDLAQLALIFRADANRAKRLAALRYLLTAAEGRYSELALHEVIAVRDEELVQELTMTVATRLPPAKAIETLERLSLVTTRQLVPAFMTLGSRKPELLSAAYEAKLATGTRPDYRAELVTGAGFQGGPTGLELARTAFAHDPEPAVRARALFVLTAQGDPKDAEAALGTALSDPDFAGDPGRLGDLVLALENLAASGATNAVDRIGARLLRTGMLRDKDRRRLRLILRRSLPPTGERR